MHSLRPPDSIGSGRGDGDRIMPISAVQGISTSIGLSDFSPALMLDEQTPAYESPRFSAFKLPPSGNRPTVGAVAVQVYSVSGAHEKLSS